MTFWQRWRALTKIVFAQTGPRKVGDQSFRPLFLIGAQRGAGRDQLFKAAGPGRIVVDAKIIADERQRRNEVRAQTALPQKPILNAYRTGGRIFLL